MRLATALRHMLVARIHAGISSRRGRVEVGDFGRRFPSLGSDGASVYDALVRCFLRPRLGAFAGPGVLVGVGTEPGWADVLPTAADRKVLSGTDGFGPELGALANAEWVVLDRCLQLLAEPKVALSLVLERLKPGTTLISLFTGIARPERDESGPLWSVAPYAARRLHEDSGELERVEVEQYGNVALALAWLYRLPADDLSERELTFADPAYPVVVAVAASKQGGRL